MQGISTFLETKCKKVLYWLGLIGNNNFRELLFSQFSLWYVDENTLDAKEWTIIKTISKKVPFYFNQVTDH